MSLDDDDSWRTYALDAEEALHDIEGSLLVLEADPAQPDEVNRLYRGLHTLKGNSALLGLTTIETLAHAAEDLVGLARDGGIELDQSMIDLMLGLVDRLKTVVERAGRERRDAEMSEVQALVEQVHTWTRAHGAPDKPVDLGPKRGEIFIWSDIPSPPSAPDQPASSALIGEDEEPNASEFFFALCREVLPRLAAALERASCSHGELSSLLAELSQPAVRLGYFELVDCLGTLDQLYEVSVTPDARAENSEIAAQRRELARLLTQLEQGERAREPGSPDFGLAALCTALIPGDAPRAQPKVEAPSAPRAAPAEAARPQPKAAAATAPRAEAAERQPAGAEFLRIDARKLSLILDLAGEIALASGAVTHHPELEGLELSGFAAASHKLEMLIRELQNEVSAMRLMPVASVFQRMQRVVRDTARRTGKNVKLSLVGEDTEIDKFMVDSLHDPLVHIVRNAIDHGIEMPDERVAAGKPAAGTIVIEASHQGGEVSVKVSDDGRGLNRQRIVARAKERGLIGQDAELSDSDIASLVFLPGFSTKEKIDELSGRGVGMDVIKTTIEGLRGRVQLESKEGRGSSLNMTVPLTLAFVEAMVVRERERLFALPIEKVSEVFKTERGQLSRSSAEDDTTIRVRNSLIPVLWLHRFYGEQGPHDEHVEGKVVVVVQNSRGSVALPVDALLGNQPVMLKPLRGVLSHVRAAAGCGMLRSGEVALALDCERLHV